MVAIATTGKVYPAAGFVEIAKYYGAKTHQFDVILDRVSDHFNTFHLGAAGQIVPEWVNEFKLE